MFKKIFISLTFLLSFNVAFATEFLGKNIEDLNRYQLNDLLKANGGKLIKVDNLVDSYLIEKDKIPYAVAAKAYYNYEGQFVGLKIFFGYDPQNLFNLRSSLTRKYGNNYTTKKFMDSLKNSRALEEKLFFDVAVWNNKNSSIEYNANTFNQEKGSLGSVLPSSNAFLFFRHEPRKKALIEQLKKQSMTNDNNKFKGVL